MSVGPRGSLLSGADGDRAALRNGGLGLRQWRRGAPGLARQGARRCAGRPCAHRANRSRIATRIWRPPSRGRVAISGCGPVGRQRRAGRGSSPCRSRQPSGRRVFSAAYPDLRLLHSALFVDHTIAYWRPTGSTWWTAHGEHLFAASPKTRPAHAGCGGTRPTRSQTPSGAPRWVLVGSVSGSVIPGTFKRSPTCPAPPGGYVIAVPDSRLFRFHRRLAAALMPWVVFALVTVLCAMMDTAVRVVRAKYTADALLS